MKNTFSAKTFAAHTFRSGTFTGVGVDVSTRAWSVVAAQLARPGTTAVAAWKPGATGGITVHRPGVADGGRAAEVTL